MKTILITAYAINPYKGSEDGTGWNIAREVAKEYKVILITRKNNIPHLDRYFESSGFCRKQIQYLGFDLPEWVLWIKSHLGSKGHVLYFYLWQRLVVNFIRKQSLEFDLTYSLNFHSDSHPHFLWKLGKPSAWGPIGHHPKIPKAHLLKPYGWRAYLTDRVFYWIKWSMRNINPAFRRCVRETARIFVINSSVAAVVRTSEQQTVKMPAVAAPVQHGFSKRSSNQFKVLSVGRFHFMKGFDVTLLAFAKFIKRLTPEETESVKLVLVGKGKEAHRLKKLSQELGCEPHVQWVEWMPHEQMKECYVEADVFLFPSHEGAGMVVPEAMSYGLPILTFDNCGPGELAGDNALKISYGNYEQNVHEFAQQLYCLFSNRSIGSAIGEMMRERQKKLFTWGQKGLIIRNELKQILS